MVRSKPPSLKKRGVDFKKVKRKIGRKLPPAKNATNTEVKSKSIVLPEQSMLSERTGMAVNRKGLTLRELLQQSSHHNAKIRKASLNGIRDLVVKHPSELKLHKHAIIEKLRERICDADKAVRETLYTLFKSAVFPALKEDITGPTVTLLMAYILNAMTHISIETRLMAFKFFELLVLTHPSSFFMHYDKVLDHFVEILRNNQVYLQDKSRLNSILGGLLHCLSLLAEKNNNTTINQNQSKAQKRLLHAYSTKTTLQETSQPTGYSSETNKLGNLVPVLVNCFEESMSVFSTTRDATGQSFEVLMCSVQCLNFASKVLVQNGDLRGEVNILPHLRKIWDGFPFSNKNSFTEKGEERFFTINTKIAEVFLELNECAGPTTFLVDKFLNFIEESLLGEGGGNKEQKEKNLGSLLRYVPKLISQASMHVWKERLLAAFTRAFEECKVESKLVLSYLSAIEEMLLPDKSILVPVNTELVHYQILSVTEEMLLPDKSILVPVNTKPVHYQILSATEEMVLPNKSILVPVNTELVHYQILSAIEEMLLPDKSILVPVNTELVQYQILSVTEAMLLPDKSILVPVNTELVHNQILSATEEMLLPEKSILVKVNRMIRYQILWIKHLPQIILKLDEKHASVTMVVLKILLRIGQTSVPSSPLAIEFDSVQLLLSEFFKGVFVKLPLECQDLAVTCLYYFSSLDPDFLKSLVSSCLCKELDPSILFKIIDVLQSMYKAGRLNILENLGFLLTLIAQFRVYPDNFIIRAKEDKSSNWATYKSLIGTIFTYLSQMGDGSLILKLLWDAISCEISKEPKLANMYGLLRLVLALDARISKQNDEEIKDLSSWIFSYTIASSIYLPKRTDPSNQSKNIDNFKFLMNPCIHPFKGNNKLLSLLMGLFTPFMLGENDDGHFATKPWQKVKITIYFLILLYDDVRVRTSLSSCQGSVKAIMETIKELLASNKFELGFDECQELQIEFDRLNTRSSLLDM